MQVKTNRRVLAKQSSLEDDDCRSPHSIVARLPYSSSGKKNISSKELGKLVPRARISKFSHLQLDDLSEASSESCTEFNAGQTDNYFDPTEFDQYLSAPALQTQMSGEQGDEDLIRDMNSKLQYMEKQQLRKTPNPKQKRSSKLNLNYKTIINKELGRSSAKTPKNQGIVKYNSFKVQKSILSPKAGGTKLEMPIQQNNQGFYTMKSKKTRKQIQDEMLAELEETINDELGSSQQSLQQNNKNELAQSKTQSSKTPEDKKVVSPVTVPQFDFSQFNFIEESGTEDESIGHKEEIKQSITGNKNTNFHIEQKKQEQHNTILKVSEHESKTEEQSQSQTNKTESQQLQQSSTKNENVEIPPLQTKLKDFEQEINDMAEIRSVEQNNQGFEEYFKLYQQDRDRTIKELQENQMSQLKQSKMRKKSTSDKSLDHLLQKKFQFFRDAGEKEQRNDTPQQIIAKTIRYLNRKSSESNLSKRSSSKSNHKITKIEVEVEPQNKHGKNNNGEGQISKLYSYPNKNDGIERISVPMMDHMKIGLHELILSMISGIPNAYFQSTSDFEVTYYNKLFVNKLRREPYCHEALFGLGKLSFSIKLYEKAETYFKKAFQIIKDPVYKCWLGFTQLVKIKYIYKAIIAEKSAGRSTNMLEQVMNDAFKSCQHNLARSASRKETEVYSNFGLLLLSIEAKNIGDLVDKKQFREPEDFAIKIKKVDEYMSYIAWAYLYFFARDNQDLAISALKELIEKHQKRPEAYILIINFYLKKNYKSGFSSYADKMFLRCNQYESFQERLMITELYALCLVKNNTPYRAFYLLQMQYSKSPHYSVILYQYAKMIILSQKREYYGSACSALQEALRTSIQRRSRSIIYYLGYLAEQNSQHLQAYIYFKAYLDSSSHKSTKKLKFINMFMELNDEKQLEKALSIQKQISEILTPSLNLRETITRKHHQSHQSIDSDNALMFTRGSLYAMTKGVYSPKQKAGNNKKASEISQQKSHNSSKNSQNGPQINKEMETPAFGKTVKNFDFKEQFHQRTPVTAAKARYTKKLQLMSAEKSKQFSSHSKEQDRDAVTESNMVTKCKELYYIDEKVGHLVLALLQSDYYYKEDKAYKVYEKLLDKYKTVDVYTQFFHFIRKSVMIDEDKVEKWVDECLKLLESDQVDAHQWVMAHIQIAKLLFHLQGKKNFDKQVKELSLIDNALVCLLKLRYVLPPIDQSLMGEFSMPIDFKKKHYSFNPFLEEGSRPTSPKKQPSDVKNPHNVAKNDNDQSQSRPLSVISEGISFADEVYLQQAINQQAADNQNTQFKQSIISLIDADLDLSVSQELEKKDQSKDDLNLEFTSGDKKTFMKDVFLDKKDLDNLFFSKSRRQMQNQDINDISFGPQSSINDIEPFNPGKLISSHNSKLQIERQTSSDQRIKPPHSRSISMTSSVRMETAHSKKSSILYFASPVMVNPLEQLSPTKDKKSLANSQTKYPELSSIKKQRSSMMLSAQMQLINSSNKSLSGLTLTQRNSSCGERDFATHSLMSSMKPVQRTLDMNLADTEDESLMQDTKFCVFSDPSFLYVLGKACIQNKCYVDLALHSLQDYIMIAYYFKAFIGEKKYERMRIKAILQIAKALLLLREPNDCDTVLSDIKELIVQHDVPKFNNMFNSIKKQALELMILHAKIQKQQCKLSDKETQSKTTNNNSP